MHSQLVGSMFECRRVTLTHTTLFSPFDGRPAGRRLLPLVISADRLASAVACTWMAAPCLLRIGTLLPAVCKNVSHCPAEQIFSNLCLIFFNPDAEDPNFSSQPYRICAILCSSLALEALGEVCDGILCELVSTAFSRS